MIIDIFFYAEMCLLIHCADLEDDDVNIRLYIYNTYYTLHNNVKAVSLKDILKRFFI